MNAVSVALSKLAGKQVDYPDTGKIRGIPDFIKPLGLRYVNSGVEVVNDGVPCVFFYIDKTDRICVEYSDKPSFVAQALEALDIEIVGLVVKESKQ